MDTCKCQALQTEPSHGFLSKSSTNHAIIELVDKITKTIEHKFTVGLVLDLPKAFDTVNHNIHWFSCQISCLNKKLPFQ